MATAALGVFALGPIWSGCATQRDMSGAQAVETSAAAAGQDSGGSSNAGSAAKAGSPGASAGTFGTSGSSGSGGMAGSGGATAMGGEPGEAGAGGSDPEAGGAGGADAGCTTGPECDDGDPCTTDMCLLRRCSYTASTAPCEDDDDPCTNDVCSMGACTHPDSGMCECQMAADCNDNNVCTNDTCAANECVHVSNTAPCPDDGSDCTDDQCAAGKCAHTDNGSCECLAAGDCDDSDPCTFNQCNAAGACVYPDNGTCGVGTPFTVNNFNSSVDWAANLTTPGGRALVDTGFTNPNLEGNANIYLAASAAASLEMNLASMVGLGKLRIVIRSVQADTGGMVHVATWNGTAWSEKALSTYAAIPTANYATIEVPLTDFAQNLADITKMRLRFAPTGGQKEWRIDEVSAAL